VAFTTDPYLGRLLLSGTYGASTASSEGGGNECMVNEATRAAADDRHLDSPFQRF
jgi:hypothetical protein